MKQRWLVLAARIDRMTLRQRAGLFGACVFVVLYLTYMLALDPLLREQARLRSQITQQHDALLGVDTQISSLVDAFTRDPDAATRRRLESAREETRSLSDSLAAMQKGMVAPEQMVPLLQSILRANGRLQLVTMTTLPVSPVGGDAPPPPKPKASLPGAAAAPASATHADPTSASIAAQIAAASKVLQAAEAPAPPKPVVPMASLLYRHGVTVTVRGSYLDMIDYMASLESLPTQLFWGQAQFEVEEYPRAHVTLTLYTLSLDSKWLKL